MSFVAEVPSDIAAEIVWGGIVAGVPRELVVAEELEQHCYIGIVADCALVKGPDRRY